MKLDKAFIALHNKILRMEKMGQTTIAKNHKKVLDDLRISMAKLYENYETDGQLTFDEMSKYNRLQKLDKEVYNMITGLYKENSNAIKGTLEGITKDTNSNTISIIEGATQKRLKGIVKALDVEKTINTDMAGLKWAERVGKHRADTIYSIQKEIKQGLSQGDTYGTMTKRLKKELEVSAAKANTIVRTEGHRCFSQSRQDSLDSIAKHGVKMQKTWLSAKDEIVRGNNPSDKMDHVSMHGVTIPYEDDFELPDGATGPSPGLIGDYNDINCRCIITISLATDE